MSDTNDVAAGLSVLMELRLYLVVCEALLAAGHTPALDEESRSLETQSMLHISIRISDLRLT